MGKTRYLVRAGLCCLALGLCLSLTGCKGDDPDAMGTMDPSDMPTVADLVGSSDGGEAELFTGMDRNTLRLIWGEADRENNGLDVYVYNESGVTVSYDDAGKVASMTVGPVETLADPLPSREVYEKYDHMPDVTPEPEPSEDILSSLLQGGGDGDNGDNAGNVGDTSGGLFPDAGGDMEAVDGAEATVESDPADPVPPESAEVPAE